MSLLTIAQEAASLLGFAEPATISGNTNRNAREYLRHLNIGGMQIAVMKNGWGAGWDALTREHELTTVANQASYDLPTDFGWMVEDSVWDREQYWSLRGPLSPQEWQRIRSGLLQEISLRWDFRITTVSGVRKITFDPTPTGAQTIVFEYGSRSWVSSSRGIHRTRFEADTDDSVFDEDLHVLDLIWRHRRQTGLVYEHDYTDFMKAVRERMALQANMPVIRSGRLRDDWFDLESWPGGGAYVTPETDDSGGD